MKKIAILTILMVLSLSAMAQATAIDTTATCGQTVTITATPDPGYQFLYWEDDTLNTNPVREVVISDLSALDTTYVAVFSAAAYQLTVNVNEADWGTVTGAEQGSYPFGTALTLTATPASKCYQFKQWSDGNTDNPRSITVGASGNSYTAVFELVEFSVKVRTSGSGTVSIVKQ